MSHWLCWSRVIERALEVLRGHILSYKLHLHHERNEWHSETELMVERKWRSNRVTDLHSVLLLWIYSSSSTLCPRLRLWDRGLGSNQRQFVCRSFRIRKWLQQIAFDASPDIPNLLSTVSLRPRRTEEVCANICHRMPSVSQGGQSRRCFTPSAVLLRVSIWQTMVP